MVRHLVKPGITGWAQVTGYRGETKELWQMEGRVQRDVWYLEHWTFLLDLYIIYKTIRNAIQGEKEAYWELKLKIKIKRSSNEKQEKYSHLDGGNYIGKLPILQKVPYLQSYESLTDKSYKEIVINEVNQQDTLYDARIQPKDLLNITINTTDPQAAAPFNLTMQTYNNIAQSNASTTSQPALQQYRRQCRWDRLPVIGRLQVGGLTKMQPRTLSVNSFVLILQRNTYCHCTYVQLQNFCLGEVNSRNFHYQ